MHAHMYAHTHTQTHIPIRLTWLIFMIIWSWWWKNETASLTTCLDGLCSGCFWSFIFLVTRPLPFPVVSESCWVLQDDNRSALGVCISGLVGILSGQICMLSSWRTFVYSLHRDYLLSACDSVRSLDQQNTNVVIIKMMSRTFSSQPDEADW